MREDELQALFLQEDSYCAHINPKTGEKQNIKTHLHNVAYLAVSCKIKCDKRFNS